MYFWRTHTKMWMLMKCAMTNLAIIYDWKCEGCIIKYLGMNSPFTALGGILPVFWGSAKRHIFWISFQCERIFWKSWFSTPSAFTMGVKGLPLLDCKLALCEKQHLLILIQIICRELQMLSDKGRGKTYSKNLFILSLFWTNQHKHMCGTYIWWTTIANLTKFNWFASLIVAVLSGRSQGITKGKSLGGREQLL